MANNKNLSAFRQLSLSCDGPKIQRKLSLKKQFSEDIPDLREWPSQDIGIKISLSSKSIRNPIKNAWTEDTIKTPIDQPVIVNKCREVDRTTSGKLTKQGSLEKDSILHSKQELAQRLRQTLKGRGDEKFNLRIFLAHDSKELEEDGLYGPEKDPPEKPSEPKLIAPLVANKNQFRIRKPISRSRTLSSSESCSYSPTTSKQAFDSSAIVVVPIFENDDPSLEEVSLDSRHPKEAMAEDETAIKAIDSVIIRPVSAASKREKFQKRINSAFTSTVKETPKPRRPLVRSSSAPCRPDQGKSKLNLPKNKFKASKRQIQPKTVSTDNENIEESNERCPKSKKELNRTTAVNGCDVVTMVSLVSPAGSDCEETVEPVVESSKGPQKKESANVQEEKNIPKIMSLRKAAKSAIEHSCREKFFCKFSCEKGFSRRRFHVGKPVKAACVRAEGARKRSTNSTIPDDNERVPKRRLVRSNTEEPKTASCEKNMETKAIEETDVKATADDSGSTPELKPEKTVTAAEKLCCDDPVDPNASANTDILIGNEKEELKSAKEKQCWNMYCKMTEKGINVSFDTILRGMLTPTEYRLSKKHTETVSNTASTEN